MAIMLQISPESNRPAGSGLPPKPPYLMEFSSVDTSEDDSALLWRGEHGWIIAVDPASRPVCYLTGQRPIRMDEQVSRGQLSRLSNNGLSSNQAAADREKMKKLLSEIAGPTQSADPSEPNAAPWKFMAAGAMVGMVLTVLLCLPFMLSAGSSSPAEAVAQADDTETPPEEVEPKEPGPSSRPDDKPETAPDRPEEKGAAETTPPEPDNEPQPLPPPEKPKPENGIYIVVLRADGEEYHLGTAWARGPRELVSSGTLVKMLTEEMRNNNAEVLVIHSQTFAEFEVASGSISPTLDRIDQQAMSVAQKREQVERALDFLRGKRAAGQNVENELKPLEKQFEELGKELTDLMTQISEYDVGTLRVTKELPMTLETSNQVSSSMEVSIAGVPLSLNSVNQAGSINDLRFVSAPGRTITRPRNGVFKLTFDARLNSERVWRGSPVLDSNGRVIGTYSTPLLLEAEENKPLPHSVIDISKIR